MKYHQATRPEKHNGGLFFEHEIHFDVHYIMECTERIHAYLEHTDKKRSIDYRVSHGYRYDNWAPGEKTNPWSPNKKVVRVVKVRFLDKNDALMFKLGFLN